MSAGAKKNGDKEYPYKLRESLTDVPVITPLFVLRLYIYKKHGCEI